MVADATADANRMNRTASRKIIPPRERIHGDELQVVLHFDGYLKYSPLFYGYYSNDEFVGARARYAVPLAYFIITLFVFGYSCFAILRKMAMNTRVSKMSGNKTEQYIFSWKLFSGWDYTIGNSDTALNTAKAIVIKLRESTAECRVDLEKKFKPLLFLTRVLANGIILAMLAFSIYTISFAVQSSETVEKTGSLFTKNQVPTIIATITNVFPMIFDLIGQVERYHPRTALRAHLTRVMVLYVLNYITFIIALFEKLDKIRGDELLKIIDERQVNGRYERFLNGKHLFDDKQLLASTTFFSRNFTSSGQADKFAEISLKRFSNLYEKSLGIRDATRRKRHEVMTRKPSSRFPDGITVESQYGPVGLNNPNALLFNKSYPWEQRRFQAIRIGPSPLPTFPIAPLPPKPTLSTNVLTELGPHWQSVSKWRPRKTTILTTAAATTATTKIQKSTETRTSVKATKIPWDSKRKPKPTRISKTTVTATTVTVGSGNNLPDDDSTTLKKGLKSESKKDDIVSKLSTTIIRTTASPTATSSVSITEHKKITETNVENYAAAQEDNVTTSESFIDVLRESSNTASTISEKLSPSLASSTTAVSSKQIIVATDRTTAFLNTFGHQENASLKDATVTTELQNVTEMILDAFAGKEALAVLNTTVVSASTGTVQSRKSENELNDLTAQIDKITDENIESTEITKTTEKSVELVTAPDQMAETAPPESKFLSKSVTFATNDTYSEVSSDTSSNDTHYKLGEKARVTTDEMEMDDHFCWETMIGQEIVKLVTMDLVITIASIFIIDFFRGLWIKYCSAWWCWDIETTFPEYGEFKVAENVLHIINNQGMVWLGLFFAPLLPALNNLKLIILMYIRGWACMVCNVPAREIFRASRSSNFYLMVLLLWLLLCTLPVGYVIASKKPSSTCGPFAGYARFYNVLMQMLEGRVDRKVISWLKYIASPGVIIPVLLLLMLIIYFLVSLVRGLREANNDLQQQLIHERTEEKKKIFELAGGTKKKASEGNREKKKQVLTYLPLVEQKRREPWRAYNGRDYDSSLCVTDETSTVITPDSPRTPSPKTLKKKQQQQLPQTVTTQIPKNSSITTIPKHIVEEESNGQSSDVTRTETKEQLPVSTSNVTDRVDEWFNEESECSETQSYNVGSDVVEVATPEEIRRVGGSSNIDQPLPSSHCEPETTRVLPLIPTIAAPVYQPWSSNENQISTPNVHHTSTILRNEIAAHPMISSTRWQVSRLPDVDVEMGNLRNSHTSNSSRRSSVRGTNHEFAAWPSVDEVQLHHKPVEVNENGHLSRKALADQRRKKAAVGPNDSEDIPSVLQQHQRRFRISVSPSRRFQTHTDPSGSDTDTSTGKRRYVIKQEVLPDSTVSVNVDSRLSQQQRNHRIQAVQAPRVEFGEDDSPKIHQSPLIEHHPT